MNKRYNLLMDVQKMKESITTLNKGCLLFVTSHLYWRLATFLLSSFPFPYPFLLFFNNNIPCLLGCVQRNGILQYYTKFQRVAWTWQDAPCLVAIQVGKAQNIDNFIPQPLLFLFWGEFIIVITMKIQITVFPQAE